MRLPPTPARTPELPSRSLLWRVAFANAAVFCVAVSMLALSPATVSFPVSAHEALILAVGTASMLVANLYALRRAFAPLVRLSRKMGSVDPLAPGVRVDLPSSHREIVTLTESFNQMAQRLEHERRESARRALHAEEAERGRIARELHDQIGQSLTFLLMQLSRLRGPDGTTAAEDIAAAQDMARAILEDARTISGRLRPESLDDLGLAPALEGLARRVQETGAVTVATDIDPDLPVVDWDTQLAVVRVAQEALTNVLRHAGATTATVSLRRRDDGLRLEVADDGAGARGRALAGGGIRGMHERALSVGGALRVDQRQAGGTCVAFDVGSERLAA